MLVAMCVLKRTGFGIYYPSFQNGCFKGEAL